MGPSECALFRSQIFVREVTLQTCTAESQAFWSARMSRSAIPSENAGVYTSVLGRLNAATDFSLTDQKPREL